MTGEPQAGQEAAPPTLFDQDSAADPSPAGGRRLVARSVGAAGSPVDNAVGPVAPADTTPSRDGSAPRLSPSGPPVVSIPPAYTRPSPESVRAAEASPADPIGLPVGRPTTTPASALAGSTADDGLLPAVAPSGAPRVEALPLGRPVDGTSPAHPGLAPTVAGTRPMTGVSPADAGISPSVAGMPPAMAHPDLRRPLVRPVPGRGRSAPQPRKTERRPSFRGTRRLTDRIGIWRKLLSFIELAIVVAVLGALLAAVIGIFIGAIVVALQKALNG